MIINISGYGYSGASAYRDLLKEYECVECFPYEFQIIQQPDGILDLEDSLVTNPRRIRINTSIVRFKKNIYSKRNDAYQSLSNGEFRKISEDYINSMISAKWNGRSTYDPIDISPEYDRRNVKFYPYKIIEKILKKSGILSSRIGMKERYYATLSEEEFALKTRDYLNSVMEACGINQGMNIILEQAFSIENPIRGKEFFVSPVKSIVVDRDPRDVYILTNVIFKSKSVFMPNNCNVVQFVEYYKGLHSKCISCSEVKYLKFEDLVFKYNETVSMLEEWLGIKQIRRKAFFLPECSVANTKLFCGFHEYDNDIKYIEEHLVDYLYPFDENYNNTDQKYFKPFDRQADIVVS